MQLSDDAVHLLANDTDWVWESDEAHIIRYLSDGYSQVTGADPAEAVGRTRLDKLLDNAGSRSSTACLDSLIAGRAFRDCICQLSTANGKPIDVSLSGIPVVDSDGKFRGYRGTARNISGITGRALSQLPQRDTRLASMLDALQDAFCYYDAQGRLVLYNQAMITMYAGLEDLIRRGTRFEDLVHAAIDRNIWSQDDLDIAVLLEQIRAGRANRAPSEVLIPFSDGRYAIHREMPSDEGGMICVCTDVTALKRRENEVNSAKQNADQLLEDLRRSLDAMYMGVVILDEELNLEIVNKAFYRIWNFDESVFSAGSSFRALIDFNRNNGVYDIPVSEWEAYVTMRLAEIRKGSVEPREFSRADGRTMIYSVTALSGGKRLVCYYDITDMKEREKQVAIALEKARLAETVIDSVPDAIFVKDSDLRYAMVNQAYAQLWNMTPPQMLGRRATDLGVMAAADEFEESERQVLNAGTTFEIEEEFEQGGKKHFRMVRKSRVHTRSGKNYVVGSIFDVTELKQRELDSRGARTYLENVLESLPAGIIIYDTEDRFVLANRQLQETMPEVQDAWHVGCPFRDALRLGHAQGHFRASGNQEVDELYDLDCEAWMDAYLERRRELHRTYIRQNPNGRWYQAIDTRTADGSFIGIRIDITELKQREEELEEAQRKAILADRAKSEFLANMSHEIRTPMNGVLGMAELLARSKLDDRQRTFTDIIVKSGNALLTIINDILDFSKIDAGQLVLDPSPFHLAEAIEDVATLVSTRAKEKDLELIVRVQPGLPTVVVGDVGRFRQIVTNLVGNAVKFTEAGHVLVDVSGHDVGDDVELRVSITDTGIGIPQDKLEQVFEKFSQVDASSTRRHEGTGLGLAITSRLVALMGGDVGVESTHGKGSTFWFTVRFPRAGDHRVNRPTPVDVSGARILIVDDNAVNRAILMEQMTSWGFDACAAESGMEGIAVLKAVHKHGLRVDCMILDYQMPDLTGADVARLVRAIPEIADTPIVMLTSVDQSLGNAIYRSLDIDAHLIKPARSSALLEAIVATIQKHRQRPEEIVEQAAAEAPRLSENAEKRPVSKPTLKVVPPPTEDGLQHKVDILVAEDNEVNQLVFTQILGETGLSFQIVGNGRLGVEAYSQLRPRMILMDVSMPEMNGLEATARIRQLEEGSDRHTPIVGVTAHALKDDRERCLDAGMDDYLSKPISPKALTQKISMWLNAENDAGFALA
ncbi:PAS-domain containing protein [Aquamicrobium zhengzhouense]|uniref:histidine kinase n=1 Tax=Aquamicrobium zhengzhouense TaxID=2781738 RepID=A0ABS0SG87_9HYPH|nr:PAS-domain containing protein [Aquamicrobium zhengzhouense]MBI1622319.1 PAS-domain containing protein [Aquamicrobium zhengzhouense]